MTTIEWIKESWDCPQSLEFLTEDSVKLICQSLFIAAFDKKTTEDEFLQIKKLFDNFYDLLRENKNL